MIESTSRVKEIELREKQMSMRTIRWIIIGILVIAGILGGIWLYFYLKDILANYSIFGYKL